MTRLMLLLALLFSVNAYAQGEAEENTFSKRIEAAMEADIRTEADTARDRNRRPVETLEFFGIEEDMRVLELIPGGGWYTKLLAPALRDTGEYYAAIGTGGVEANLLDKPGFDHIKVLKPELEMERNERRLMTVQPFSLGVEGLDAALTFRNQHNFSAQGRASLNEAVFEALRPGGIYGVVDHTRRHMQTDDGENRRRLDPVMVIKEIEAAGFEFVDYTTLHYRPDDELRYEVGRKSVTGNTDRFTLLFRKPASS